MNKEYKALYKTFLKEKIVIQSASDVFEILKIGYEIEGWHTKHSIANLGPCGKAFHLIKRYRIGRGESQ